MIVVVVVFMVLVVVVVMVVVVAAIHGFFGKLSTNMHIVDQLCKKQIYRLGNEDP